ncbi:hypothetical protein [Nocardiopsis coralli]|uniref:hypothetical protein n=1 Tax=Nocardiopsis coralli TaxID=2772213 RepID=UPI001F33D1C3|nr:hypothetical protein [Nocardiopsis coralli]
MDIHMDEFLDAASDALAVPPGPHPVADFLLVRGLRRRTDAVRQALELVRRDGDADEALELLDRVLSEPPVPARVSECGLIDPGPGSRSSLSSSPDPSPGAHAHPHPGAEAQADQGFLPRPRPWPGL